MKKDVQEKKMIHKPVPLEVFLNCWKKGILFIKGNDLLIARENYVIILS